MCLLIYIQATYALSKSGPRHDGTHYGAYLLITTVGIPSLAKYYIWPKSSIIRPWSAVDHPTLTGSSTWSCITNTAIRLINHAWHLMTHTNLCMSNTRLRTQHQPYAFLFRGLHANKWDIYGKLHVGCWKRQSINHPCGKFKSLWGIDNGLVLLLRPHLTSTPLIT